MDNVMILPGSKQLATALSEKNVLFNTAGPIHLLVV